MKKKIIGAALTLAFCLGMSGCGENQIPEMADEDLQTVGEYAAITLMKYDANNRSRLVELPEETIPPVTEESEPEEEKPSGMEPVDDVPIINPGAEDIDNLYTMEEVMGLPEGVTVSYLGYELCESYPHDTKNDSFAISAVQGWKLLVLKFSIENGFEQEQEVDLLSGGTTYRVTVNGTDTYHAQVTMLLNDMTTFADTISGNESNEVVLVMEVEKDVAENLSSVSLELKNESKTYTIQLL